MTSGKVTNRGETRPARNILITVQRDSHPCTYSLFDPADRRCQFCGKERDRLNSQGFHEGNMHFDGTFETHLHVGFESVKPVTLHVDQLFLDVPFIVTAAELLDDGFWKYTVTATKRTGFPQ